MVKFYRGLYSSYDYNKATNTGKHVDCVYFATDVGRILMNGTEFGSPVDISLLNSVIKDVSISNNVLTFTLGDDTTFDITIPTATLIADGAMSSSDKKKLDNIQEGANNYTHPSYTANTGVPVSNQTPSFGETFLVSLPISDSLGHITSINAKTITIPSDTATASTSGLMSSSDKSKLDGIAAGATANEGTITGIKMNGVSKGTSGVVDLGTVITSHQDISGKLNVSLKGAANGLAELDSNGKVPSSQLPSYVDDVLEYSSKSVFPTTGESGKIYIDTATNLSYRWGGTTYVEISPSLALGETSSTAYRGDRGKTAYDHSLSAHARTDATKVEKSSTNGNIKINGTETTVYTHPSGTNPHGTTKSDVGLGNVGNFKAVSTVASLGLTDTEKANARANIGAGTSSFSGSYNDLSNKPTVGNGTITITLNGATRGTFTTNLSGNTTIALTDNNTWRGIQDNLNSSSSTDSLSANQGRILNLTKVGFAKVSAAEIAKTNNNPFFGNVENEDIGIGNGNYYSVINLGSYSGGNFRSQIAMPYQDSIVDSDIYIRTDRSGTWRAWRKLIHSGNIGSQNVNYANSANSAGTADRANITAFSGNHAETASGTTGNTPSSGMLYSSGLYITGTYADANTPVSYGNIINIAGLGTGLLLCEWSGTDSTLGRLYYRSHRDTSTGGWSNWGAIAYTTDNVASATNDSAGQLINTTYIKGLSVSGKTITYTKGNGATGTITTLDTTYSANNGVGLSGTTFYNSGVRAIATGSANGTISVNTNGTTANVAVKGLGTAAYTNSGAYATASHTHNYAASPSAGGAANSSNVLNANARMDYGWNGINYFNADLVAGCKAKTNDAPTSTWWHIMRFNHGNNSGYYTDLAIPFNSDSLYWKTVRGGNLPHASWVQVLDAINYNSYAPTKTGGGASGTWGISVSGNAATATKVVATVTGANGTELVRGNIADNDFFRIYVGGTGSNAGYAEIATADDGSEPIYVRQYTGTFSNLTRTLTLLDGNGNTTLPGTITSTGFKKSGSSDLYVLLGGGGHRGINDHSHTGALVTMGGYSTLSGGYVTTSDTVNSAIHKIEDLLLWYELN